MRSVSFFRMLCDLFLFLPVLCDVLRFSRAGIWRFFYFIIESWCPHVYHSVGSLGNRSVCLCFCIPDSMCFIISVLQSNIVFVAWHSIACEVVYVFMCVMVSVVYDEFVCHCSCIQSSVFAYHSMCSVICLYVVMVSVV